MNFTTGELTFHINSKNPDAKLNATEILAYQYLTMTKVISAPNTLPATFVRDSVTNIKAKQVMENYRKTQDYLTFFEEFLHQTDNGRHAVRVADALNLKVVKIELALVSVRLYLQPKEVLSPIGESIALPPRQPTILHLNPTEVILFSTTATLKKLHSKKISSAFRKLFIQKSLIG